MRNSTQVETREIADNDLDHVSGGVSVYGGGTVGLSGASGGVTVDGLAEVVEATKSALPGSPASGQIAF